MIKYKCINCKRETERLTEKEKFIIMILCPCGYEMKKIQEKIKKNG